MPIPPYEVSDKRHPNATCRWCGESFMPVWVDELTRVPQWLCPTPLCAQIQLEWAMPHPTRARYANIPTPATVMLMAQRRHYLLWGGAANAAKTHGLRWGLHYWCTRIPGLSTLLMRRSFPELESTHLASMLTEQHMIAGAHYAPGQRTMHYGNGSFCRAGHCESANDLSKLLSTEYDRIVIDEGVTFQDDLITEIGSRSRSAKPLVIELMGTAHTDIGSNPGGPAHAYLKAAYMDHDLDRDEYPTYDPDEYDFIAASSFDNPYGDPNYEKTLGQMKKARRDQLMRGDWNVYVGQFFPMFESAHVLG